ncbi:MAG TPA: hypothetical protein VG410_05000 [Solirubrobacteraceae bacterium]|nr:hypothetical protein [Solirubrobacteraceae bacterium]
MDAAQASDVAEPRQVEANDIADERRIGREALERVVGEAACARARSSQLARLTSS